MDRREFKEKFGCHHSVVLPVIHVINTQQTLRNIVQARAEGCPGVFLINHDFGIDQFLPIIREARQRFPDYWLGINFLAVTGADAFPILADLEKEGIRTDAYWGDDARIDETLASSNQLEAQTIRNIKQQVGWDGMYFGGTAFKKQREVAESDYEKSAQIACDYMDVVTTSGIATGKAADTSKIETFRAACGENPIALASGITPKNVDHYSDLVDCLMVATGINIEGDFYNIDPARLKKLMNKLKG